MKINTTPLEGCLVIESAIYTDNRGHFQETYNQQKYEFLSPNTQFVQDNLSKSNNNVLRGIHFQQNYPQGKLIRVVSGMVFDVAVDLRPNSKTFGKYYKIILNEKNSKFLLIPKGFAHGFLAKKKENIVLYSCSNYRDRSEERSIAWNDKKISINWGIAKPIISKRDAKALSFGEIIRE